MMTNEIITKAQKLNAEAAELNEARKQAEWAKKKAEEDLNTALAAYNKKYGTNLTVADIETAYAAEEKKVHEQIKTVEGEIEAVKNGATEVVPSPIIAVKEAEEAEENGVVITDMGGSEAVVPDTVTPKANPVGSKKADNVGMTFEDFDITKYLP